MKVSSLKAFAADLVALNNEFIKQIISNFQKDVTVNLSDICMAYVKYRKEQVSKAPIEMSGENSNEATSKAFKTNFTAESSQLSSEPPKTETTKFTFGAKCNKCNQKFSSRNDLRRHVQKWKKK